MEISWIVYIAVSCVLHNYSAGFTKALGFRMIKNWAGFKSLLQRKVEYYGYGHNFWDPYSREKYRIDYTKEWVMRLCNPRVCGYPEAKPRDNCKQVGYSA